MYSEAIGSGAVGLYEVAFDEGLFLPNQDISGYYTPRALLNVPRNCRLHHNEPFGPIDSIVIVDRVEELIAEMNISNGCLVSSIACDDQALATQIASDLRAFKVGINQVRSRGDRDEAFGGVGSSWRGCFVGAKDLVQAVTEMLPGERLYGSFPGYTLLPEVR
jgi:acyl-CoA reductase-like NAD-dependent aldehyde dehydrogenase